MHFYIKEWPNKTVTLMAANGTVLWTFVGLEEAEEVIRSWAEVQGGAPGYRVFRLGPGEVDAAA